MPFILPLAALRISVYKGKGAGWSLRGSKWSCLEGNYWGGQEDFPISCLSHFSWNSSGFEHLADPAAQGCFCDGETPGLSWFTCPLWVQSIHSACAAGTLQAPPSRETPGSCRLWRILVCLLVLSCHVHLSRQLLYDSLYTPWKDMKRFISSKEESGQERARGGELSQISGSLLISQKVYILLSPHALSFIQLCKNLFRT